MTLENHLVICDHVRKRPGMYVGSTSMRGLVAVIGEVIGNPIDLFLQQQVSTIDVQLDGFGITVTDDGPGWF